MSNALRSVPTLVTILAGACLALPAPASAQSGRDSVSLTRSGCEARCPVYSVSVSRDGPVRYEGRHYVRKAGVIASRIAAARAGALLAELPAAAPASVAFGAPECGSGRADGARIEITFTPAAGAPGGWRATLDGRCGGPQADALRTLARRIDEASGAARLAR